VYVMVVGGRGVLAPREALNGSHLKEGGRERGRVWFNKTIILIYPSLPPSLPASLLTC